MMKKTYLCCLGISGGIMLALPWAAVTFVKADGGMAVCLLLFYVVNPIYSVVIGAFAGKDRKHLGSLPVVSAVLFLIGTWLFFGMGEPAFIRYGVIYLALGIGAMAISSIVRKKKK